MTITQQEFELLREYIHRHCGIVVGDGKTYLIESRLAHLVVETGCSTFEEFYRKTTLDPTGSLRDKIVDAITTNETLWFRDGKPWVTLREQVLPELIQKVREGRQQKIRIWCAASSTGQEPYSLAMLIDSMLPAGLGGAVTPAHFEIVATDISPSVLFLAISGRYNQIEMSRGMEESFKTKYFSKMGVIWVLNEAIRKRVTFKKFNLQDSLAALGKFDMVLCRNVAIYFSDEFKKGLFSRIAQALNPAGFFFLGAAESLMGHSTAFKMVEYKQGIYYRKMEGA